MISLPCPALPACLPHVRCACQPVQQRRACVCRPACTPPCTSLGALQCRRSSVRSLPYACTLCLCVRARCLYKGGVWVGMRQEDDKGGEKTGEWEGGMEKHAVWGEVCSCRGSRARHGQGWVTRCRGLEKQYARGLGPWARGAGWKAEGPPPGYATQRVGWVVPTPARVP